MPQDTSYTYSWQVVWTNSSGSKTVLYRSVPAKTARSDYFGVVSGSKFVELPGLRASEFSDPVRVRRIHATQQFM